MITRFVKNDGESYYNILQLGILFIATEVIEIFKFFKIYDPQSDTYDVRKIIWLGIAFGTILFIYLLVVVTCITLLTLAIAGLT